MVEGVSGPGAYGRKTKTPRTAEFAYNHIVCVDMLIWLIEAAQVRPDLVRKARRASRRMTSLQEKAAAVRRHVPWQELCKTSFETNPTSPLTGRRIKRSRPSR